VWRQVGDDRFEKINLIPPQIVSTIDAERYEIYHDSRDIIWITTYGNGLFSLDLNNGRTRHYTVDNSDLSANHLLCVMEDKSGEIWIGTEFAGIGKISLSNYPVQILEPAPNDSYNRNNVVRLLYEDSQKRFWLGTRNGFLHTYDASLRKTRTQKIEGGLPFSMVEDSSGNLWLGTRGNGVFLFPPSGKAPLRNFRLEENPQYSGSNNVFDIMLDTKSRLWVASLGGGLHCADITGKNIEFRQIDLSSGNQTQRMLRVIVQDHTGMIWVGGNDGVLVFNPDELLRDNSKFINFSFDINNNKSLNNNQVKAIYEDSKGRLWFGATGGGLNLLMREDPVERSWFKHYTAKNGLSNELIQAIIEDNEGYIWVSTEGGSGISRFNPQTERFENFSFSNDKQTELFDEDVCWKMDDGRLMFGSYSGVFIFDPSKMKYDSYTPPIVITDLKINGTDVLPGENNSPLKESITLSSEIHLKYNQNSFNIAFAMLNFHLPNFNQYTYYLEGYEKSWNPVTRYNIAAYRNVKPGIYYFKVKGCNSFGVWTDTETTLKMVITPPFWKSVWAYLLYLILLGIAVFFAVRIIMQINSLHTAVEVERRLTDYKLRFFTNISHEFRTPLTIIRGSIENLTAMENLPPAVTKQINVMAKGSSRLLRLIEQLLTFRKLQNQKMELKLERIEAVAFFYDIFQTFEDLAKKKNIEFLFRSGLPQREMLLDRSIWDKIAYNLLSNAMKHTPDNGKIVMRLDFYAQEDKMALSVEDNGYGVPKEKQGSLFERFAQLDSTAGGTGVGLHLTAELANLHKGKAGYNASQLGGACFSVSIPLSDENYTKEEIIETNPSTGFNSFASGSLPETLPGNKQYKDYKLLIIEDVDIVELYGVKNANYNFIVSQFPKLKIISRGKEIRIIGDDTEIERFENKLNAITEFLLRRRSLTESALSSFFTINENAETMSNENDIIVYGNNGRVIRARTDNQRKLVELYGNNDLLFAIGPAGSGKTYTAIALAVCALRNKEVRKIILTRPAVEAGERLGFLPGDLKEKLDPYLQPLYDALNDMIPPKKLQTYIEDGTVQIAPLAYMRGRTLDNAFVILDEAQNTTLSQIKMFLTRMGCNAKFIVTGDVTQIDLPQKTDSGLLKIRQILVNIKNIGFIDFDNRDIIRHPLVKTIINAFEKNEEEIQKSKNNESDSKNRI
jgi:phosphate starvation-inducible protein PhoH/signal transduction histidine kinase/streptogramin lyase